MVDSTTNERQVVAGETGGDGHQLERDRRQPLEQDDQRAPFGIGGAELLHPLAITIGRDQPRADGVVEERADRVAEKAAEHRGNRADEGVVAGARRIGERHRHQDHVRRDRKERALRERHRRERRHRMAARGEAHRPVIEAAKHPWPSIAPKTIPERPCVVAIGAAQGRTRAERGADGKRFNLK